MNGTASGPEEVSALPMDGLRAVNGYAVLGREGNIASALDTLGLGFPRLQQCLATHHHRYHYTLAVGLSKRTGLIIGLDEGEGRATRSEPPTGVCLR